MIHSKDEYKIERGFHTNEAESYFSPLKRGTIGAFHHVSPMHLHRYCDEFDFRWSNRQIKDAQRRNAALKQVEGKPLYHQQPIAGESPA